MFPTCIFEIFEFVVHNLIVVSRFRLKCSHHTFIQMGKSIFGADNTKQYKIRTVKKIIVLQEFIVVRSIGKDFEIQRVPKY